MEKNYFKTLSWVKCSVDKKQNLNYITWSEAWSEVKLNFPKSTYKRIKWIDWGYLQKSGTWWMCEVEVTIENITHSIDLPVLDFRNQPVAFDKIDSFQINKTLMRAFTKAIAMHWIWLYVYRWEDLPNAETDKPRIEEKKPKFTDKIFEVMKEKTNFKNYFEAKENIDAKYSIDLKLAKIVKSYYETKDEWVQMKDDWQPPF